MEQRKTLWIIAAVSVFLLVVLGFALIFSQGSTRTVQTNTSIIPVEKTNYSDGWSASTQTEQNPIAGNESTENSADTPIQVKDMFVVSENTTVFDLNQDGTTIDLNTLKSQYVTDNTTVPVTTTTEEKAIVVKNEATDYYVGSPTTVKETAAVAERTEKAASVKQTEKKVTTPAKTTTTNATASTPAKTTTTTSTAKPATTASTVAEKPVTRYWVQVASYSNKKTAENSRAILADNRITSDIYTYQDASNTLYYRVRVGPYTTKSEAEYWMQKISQISEFSKAGSYVTVTNN